MRQKAYIRGNKYFLGTITLDSGERFNFTGGQRFLYLMLPFLQWVMPIYCWKEYDDINQGSNIIWPLAVLFTCTLPLIENWGAGYPVSFYIPPILSIGIAIILGIVFVKYMSHKFRIPQNVTLYKIRIHPGTTGVLILLIDVVVAFTEIVALWITISAPFDFNGPYLLLICTPLFSYMNNMAALSLRKCSVEFLEKVEN